MMIYYHVFLSTSVRYEFNYTDETHVTSVNGEELMYLSWFLTGDSKSVIFHNSHEVITIKLWFFVGILSNLDLI